MKPITHTLIKKGLNGLLFEDEYYFKDNIVKTISFKLNESIKETKIKLQNKLFFKNSFTEPNSKISAFIQFVENFKPGKYTFKNGSNINISDSDIKNLKRLFESLSCENRKKMAETIFETPQSLAEHIEISNKTKGLL
jgi:hypothetical protein